MRADGRPKQGSILLELLRWRMLGDEKEKRPIWGGGYLFGEGVNGVIEGVRSGLFECSNYAFIQKGR